jgi:hypothetical protein
MKRNLKKFISFIACSTCEYHCELGNKVCRFYRWFNDEKDTHN